MTSRCESRPGMCCGDPMCKDHFCPGHPGTLIQCDGGRSVNSGTVTRRDEPPVTTDDFFTWVEDMWGAGLTVAKYLAAAAAFIFVLAMSGRIFDAWPQIVAAISF